MSFVLLEKRLNKVQGMLDKSAQYTNTDDEKLFSFIEKGDKGAFTQAYDRYHKLLYVLLPLFNECRHGRRCSATCLCPFMGI